MQVVPVHGIEAYGIERHRLKTRKNRVRYVIVSINMKLLQFRNISSAIDYRIRIKKKVLIINYLNDVKVPCST